MNTLADVTPNYAAYEAKHAAYRAKEAELRIVNKAALFAALRDIGVHSVEVSFDGSSDSGQIERIDTIPNGPGTIALSARTADYQSVQFADLSVKTDQHTLDQIVESMAFELLQHTNSGWETSDGAHGKFTFCVEIASIYLDYHERFMDETYSHHEF